jgi:hypothetical protein
MEEVKQALEVLKKNVLNKMTVKVAQYLRY